jgi:hypothetical protein
MYELERAGLFNTLCRVWPNLNKHKDRVYTYYVGPVSDPWDLFESADDSTFIKNINEQIDNNKDIICLYNISEIIKMVDIDKIHRCLSEIKIHPSKIYYFTGALDGVEGYDEYCKAKGYAERITILAANLFMHVAQSLTLPEVYKERVTKVRPKKFLCFNRVERTHRIVLVGNLILDNLLDTGYCSFYGNQFDSKWMKPLIRRPEISEELRYVLYKNKHLFPMHLNADEVDRRNPIGINLADAELFENSYYSIVTETYFFKDTSKDNLSAGTIPAMFFTEKTYKPIAMRHPFILVSRADSLKWLRNLGFKTFSPFINESYDDETNDENRMNMIVDEIKRLNQLSDSEWIEWQQNIKDIVDYNFELFITSTNYAFNPNQDLDFY